MRGGHDLGGRQGFGPIRPEPESAEPVFHSEWEQRVFAMTLATGMLGQWNIDQSRHARERQHPVDYLAQSYYRNWLAGTEKLLLEAGLLSAEELEQAMAQTGEHQACRDAPGARAASKKELRIPGPDDARKILHSGGPASRKIDRPPRFAPGEQVLLRRKLTSGHTRAPAYAQGCPGRIRACLGGHVFPDANSAGEAIAHHLYSVCFDSPALWGADAEPFTVLIDLWEPYLEAVDAESDRGR